MTNSDAEQQSGRGDPEGVSAERLYFLQMTAMIQEVKGKILKWAAGLGALIVLCLTILGFLGVSGLPLYLKERVREAMDNEVKEVHSQTLNLIKKSVEAGETGKRAGAAMEEATKQTEKARAAMEEATKQAEKYRRTVDTLQDKAKEVNDQFTALTKGFKEVSDLQENAQYWVWVFYKDVTRDKGAEVVEKLSGAGFRTSSLDITYSQFFARELGPGGNMIRYLPGEEKKAFQVRKLLASLPKVGELETRKEPNVEERLKMLPESHPLRVFGKDSKIHVSLIE